MSLFMSFFMFLSSLSDPSLADASLDHLQALEGSDHVLLIDVLSAVNEVALDYLPASQVLRVEDALAGVLLDDFD